jgi:rhodanese-related sulfurtransferase
LPAAFQNEYIPENKEDAMSVTTIGPAELRELLNAEPGLDLIDVGTPVEFRAMHVVKARNIPLDQLDPQSVIHSRQPDVQRPIFLICQAGTRGRNACEKFIRAGYSNVVNIEGGTRACAKQGVSVVRGQQTMSLERQVRIAAGSLVFAGVVLGWLVHPAFFGLAGFVGAGLVFAGVTDTCGMALLLGRLPWNQVRAPEVAEGASCSIKR